jgi:PTS system nitrogen regulatory IIA component
VKIQDFLRPQAVLADLTGRTAAEVLAELSRPVAQANGLDPVRLVQVLLDREKLGSTGVGEGVAIPHGKWPGLPALVATVGRSREGIEYRASDGKPARIFFALFAPENSAGAHLKALSRVSRILRTPAFREAILAAASSEEIYRLIMAEDVAD